MSRTARTRTTFAAVAICAALLLPASQAAASGGLASAGGAHTSQTPPPLISWVSGFKLRVAKRIQPLAVCSVACNVTGTGVLKGLGGKATFSDSGAFEPQVLFGLYVTVKGGLLKLMKKFPGRFRLNETLTATDPATGATQTISRTFKFKR